ncbi:PREDICTED: transcription elongation regulator 1-like isoform X2 [Lupinus angustifolius]|uniref:transcription elongation regulator 1-like isoform X2 n=1 Tax=Lupinus angustifolius TaxID=3871 RepID=UPI00092EDA32|nr:PREDICTED: transcription elongation regulator 1-like isoform X2 [Lupinus angustifolius]
MDSFHQPQPPPPPPNYIRPPPPPQPPLPPPPHTAVHQLRHPPFPPQAPWFSTQQFQYHHTPSPPPPPQWPPPHSSSSNPYSYNQNHFHAPNQFPQPYPQEWSNNPTWPTNQPYLAHKNEEDWAAKARAWADAKTAMESQHPNSHFSPAGRLQEQSHYHDQYQQSVDPRYAEIQNQPHPPSSYQQFSYMDASAHRLSGHSQEAAPVSLESSYASDGHSYGARDRASIGDPNVSFKHGNPPSNSSFHQQEVPSSYSSVAGNQIQQSYTMLPFPSSSSHEQQHFQPSMQAPFANGSNSVDPAISFADQPLDFAPRFSRESDLQMQSTYSLHDSGTSMNNWAAPVAPGIGYPPIPPTLASGPQHDPSITSPGHMAPPYGRFPGPGIPPTVPPSGAPFTISSGTTIQHTVTFPADAYGVSGIPERPKKASVPNWLREEIKKTVITAPSVEHRQGETTYMDDDIDKLYVKADEADSKSIDSSRSAEDEEDEEDLVRTAAINQEIKRVLTEVLLKVTDELFDEIATKVLSEDDATSDVGHHVATSNHKSSASPPAGPVYKASAKVLIPVKAKELENDSAGEKSNSSSPGDVLGLGNYGSDADDGDDEIKSSSVPVPSKDVAYHSGISSSLELEEHHKSQTSLVNNVVNTSSLQPNTSNGGAIGQLHADKVTKESDHPDSSKVFSKDNRDTDLNTFERSEDRFNGFSTTDASGIPKPELSGKNGVEKATNDHSVREGKRKSEKNDRHDRNYSDKDLFKEVQSSKTRTDEKGNENHRRKDERHSKKEKSNSTSEAKERVKEHNSRQGEKVKESESRKRSSHVDVKDDKKEAEKPNRGVIEDNSRKKEPTKDKGVHKSRQKDASNSDRHQRRRSSSVSSRGRTSKDRAVNHAGDSSGEGSDGSKRKLHSRKRDLSPSPVRSKRRQVSRSPHSKRSQRRHSPYSSLDTSRFVAIKFFKISIYVFERKNFHHHIRISYSGELVKLLHIHLTMLLRLFTLFAFLCRGRRSRSRSPARRQR